MTPEDCQAKLFGCAAVVFDLDGVLTDTARVHSAAWKLLFDGFLQGRARQTGTDFQPFTEADYVTYVDGRPRYDGVATFLDSRSITVPRGRPQDPPDANTVYGLGKRKDALFHAALERYGVDRFPTSVRLVEALRANGVRTAVVSSSRNCAEVVERAGLAHLFDDRVDGVVLDELGLPGKPHPAMFLEAARRLDVKPEETAVVEDAVSGVEAGRRGGFALVIGVDRHTQPDRLLAHGADVVVSDLGELLPEGVR
jgi:beta-phosphoglucomutase family hydrolase